MFPPAGIFEAVEAIWGSGPNDIYAIGRNGNLWHSTGDGTWTSQNTPTGANLTGIWGSGPNDIYVSVDANIVLHSTGDGGWENDYVFDPGIVFRGVGGLDAEHVYAVGGGVRPRLPMGGWDDVETVAGGGATTAFWASSPTDRYVTAAGAVTSIVYHSAGDGTWQAQDAPQSSGAHDIWGSGPNHIYVASSEAILFSTGDGNWTTELPATGVRAVWGASTNAVYACGGGGLFYRSNGAGDWSDGQEIDPSAASPPTCFSVWGTGPDNIYLGTSRGIYHGVSAE